MIDQRFLSYWMAYFSPCLSRDVLFITFCCNDCRFRRENRQHLELNQRAQFAGIAVSQWLSLRLQLLGVAMVTGVSVIAMIEHSHQAINASECTTYVISRAYCTVY
jgi:hypothetical protein